MSIESFKQRRKPIYALCLCNSSAGESKDWETFESASKALYENGFLPIVHQAAGTRFWFVYCSKSEWKKANSIVKEYGVHLSNEPVSLFYRKLITGWYFF